MTNPHYDEIREKVNARLLDHAPTGSLSAVVGDALLHGKRLRPILVFLTGEMFGAKHEDLLDAACALEMVHVASLLLDDLPSMDNGVIRHGMAALHLKHGEGTAILGAVSLMSRAFNILSDDQDNGWMLTDSLSFALTRLADGQADDLQADPNGATSDEIEDIYLDKTAALFLSAVEFGAQIGKAINIEWSCLTEYALGLGVAFQIADDLRKDTSKKSLRQHQPNYVFCVGEAAARKRIAELVERACFSLVPLGERAEPLIKFAGMIEGV